MLATVTPLAEQGRGHRYGTTAAWFIVGGTAGGATLGLAMAALAVGVRAAAPSNVVVAAVAVAVAVAASASDTRLGGFRLPFHSRQVNERWLDQFRPWVYGAGFGWQIGAGLTTYIKTAAIYLMIVLAALTADPATALATGALFGLVRGLAVLLGRHISSPGALAAFHRHFTEIGPVFLVVVVVSELAVAGAFAAVLSPWATLALGLLAAGAVVSVLSRSRTPMPASASARTSPHEPGDPPDRSDRLIGPSRFSLPLTFSSKSYRHGSEEAVWLRPDFEVGDR